MWTGHQDLTVNKFLDCSDKNIFKNLTHDMGTKWIIWQLVLSCGRHLFKCSWQKEFYSRWHLINIIWSSFYIVQVKSRILEWRMLHFDPEVENIRIWINVWKESKALLPTLTPDTLQQRFPLPMNKTALGLFLPPNIQGVNLSNCSKLHQYTVSGGMCRGMGIVWKIYKAENKN